jgi:hypothetical protein
MWVRRRVESIEIVDDTSVHRRVSIDFQIPRQLNLPVNRGLLPFAPLTFLEKAVLYDFDLRDGEGRPVPMLTKSENGQLAGDTLVAAAEGRLNRALPGSIEGRLRLIAESEPEAARQELKEWARLARDRSRPDRRLWRQLMADQGFRDYSAHLARNFILCAVTDPMPGERRLMKLSYEETFVGGGPRSRDGTSRRERTLERMGWRPKKIGFASPAVNLAASFHVEIAAPPEMEIDIARLDFRRPDSRPDKDQPPVVQGQLVQRAHLYAPQVKPGLLGEVSLYLRARRPGLLRASMLIGLVMAGLLALGFAFFGSVTAKATSQTAAAVILLGPTLLAAALTRPGEHQLVSFVMSGTRALIWAEIVATVFAGSLLAGVGEGIRKWLWLGAMVVSALAAIGLIVSNLLPRPTHVSVEAEGS